jgi:hypothetical protein
VSHYRFNADAMLAAQLTGVLLEPNLGARESVGVLLSQHRDEQQLSALLASHGGRGLDDGF